MNYPINKDFTWLKYIHMTKNLSLLKWENPFVKFAYSLQSAGKNVYKKTIDIPSRDGKKITIDLFYPKKIEPSYKTLIYFPGGGFLMRASHFHKKNLCHLVRKTNVLGIMVHYRLAPEYPFPTFLYDAIDTLQYLFAHAKELSIDSNHIGLGGDSAGGNIAMGLALYNRDYLHHPIQSVMLVYPGLAKGISNESRRNYVDTPMFNASMFPLIEKVVYHQGMSGLDYYAFPLEHPNLSSLGKIYVETAEYDCLRDDGLEVYKRLKEINASVTLNETLGTVHGYDVVNKSPITKSSLQKRCDFISESLSF